MREFNRHWTRGRSRRHLCIRFWWGGNPIRAWWRWFTGAEPRKGWGPPVEMYCRGSRHGFCYCDQGRTTTFRFAFFGVGMWGWLTRDTCPHPCHCDKIMWLCFPENHEDDIEDYGREKLQAEYPGVGPLDQKAG